MYCLLSVGGNFVFLKIVVTPGSRRQTVSISALGLCLYAQTLHIFEVASVKPEPWTGFGRGLCGGSRQYFESRRGVPFGESTVMSGRSAQGTEARHAGSAHFHGTAFHRRNVSSPSKHYAARRFGLDHCSSSVIQPERRNQRPQAGELRHKRVVRSLLGTLVETTRRGGS